MNEIRSEILKHLEKNSKADLGELAILLGTDEISVANEIADMEKEGIICGYHTLIDWDKAGRGFVQRCRLLLQLQTFPLRSRKTSELQTVHNLQYTDWSVQHKYRSAVLPDSVLL